MELTLLERLLIVSSLQKEGNMKDIRIRKDIRQKTEWKQDDFKDFQIEFKENGVVWNEKGTKAKFNIGFTELEVEEIVKGLKKLDEDGKLTEEYENLWDSFVEKK